ncbi:MAG TPA: YcxB family protein [Verrucomicrobiae bacterium]|nr:YcxB family protein [Verrucomicrobiae bacterium]
MTVEFQFESADLIAIAKERPQFIKNPWLRFYYSFFVPALAVALAIMVQSITIAIVFVLIFVLSGWFINVRVRQSSIRKASLNDTFIKRHWVASLKDEGVRISSDLTEMLYRWPAFQRVFRGSRLIYLEITPSRRVRIPTQAFRDEKHIQEFISKAESYIKRTAC